MLLVLSLSPRGFSLGTPVALVFSSPQKSAFLNSSWIQNTIDKKALCSDNNDNNGNNNNDINNYSNYNNISLEKFKSLRKSNSFVICNSIQTDHQLEHNRADLVVVDKQQAVCQLKIIIDVDVPGDARVEPEGEN